MINAFRVFLALSWLVMVAVSWRVIAAHGMDGTDLFFGDMAGDTWRAQFNVDFLIHILFAMWWVVWREKSKLVGALCAVGCLMLGSVFTAAYVLVSLQRAGGDVRRLLLGAHA
ncbi:MAG: hypothetical protein AB7Q97_07795 [Gammaproteobacteria bacterium]